MLGLSYLPKFITGTVEVYNQISDKNSIFFDARTGAGDDSRA
jgi:hypothetical protein